MMLQTVTFKNASDQLLKGRLELPVESHPHNFVIFAHCFTCTKNLSAVKNISRALTARGFGVLRFDFTGLGESEGEFSDTNFSHNVNDLIAASGYLKENHQAPTLLVGHSLGGAAVYFAGAQLESVRAIATVGAPSNPQHVSNLFKQDLDTIQSSGEAVVSLGGRDFKIKKQFLEDLNNKSLPSVLSGLDRALLILHSPQDKTVGIKNAEELYHAAKHPKSFVSLDGADHLLSNSKDSTYTGQVIAGWASRYLILPEEEQLKSKHQVVASLDNEDRFTTQMKLGDHYLVADEPIKVGGNNFGPTPYDLVSAGLASCTAMTIQMYARRKKWDIDNIEVHISYDKQHAKDCENCEEGNAKIDTFTREIKIDADLDDKQLKRLLEIADKCPVHRTLHSPTQVVTTYVN